MENLGQAPMSWAPPAPKAATEGPAPRRAGPSGDAVLRPLQAGAQAATGSRASMKFPSISSNELHELWKQQSNGAHLAQNRRAS